MTSDRDQRDPERPARLLRAERDALLPILRSAPASGFDRPTACPGWSVRDVLAHCAAALSRAASGDLHAFTPELNEADVQARRDWPVSGVLDELADGYERGGAAIAAGGGRLDPIALGEWIHGGDVRAALGEPMAYASAGFEDACALLAAWTQRQGVPLVHVTLPGGGTLSLGTAAADRPPAQLAAGNAALMKLFAGRAVDPAEFELTGATPAELVVF
jgi:uncharacterized protein (TIGR03083 family)